MGDSKRGLTDGIRLMGGNACKLDFSLLNCASSKGSLELLTNVPVRF